MNQKLRTKYIFTQFVIFAKCPHRLKKAMNWLFQISLKLFENHHMNQKLRTKYIFTQFVIFAKCTHDLKGARKGVSKI
jgi:hypothetical protein